MVLILRIILMNNLSKCIDLDAKKIDSNNVANIVQCIDENISCNFLKERVLNIYIT